MGCQKLHISKSNYTFKKVVRGGLFKEEKTCAEEYRFGFNGQEKLNEQYGEGNAYDFGARIFDPRICRWLSTDPLQKKYATFSPYIFTFNSPLMFKDGDGKDGIVAVQKDPNGGGKITISTVIYITGESASQTKADILNRQASTYFQPKTLTGNDGNTWTVEYNIKYEYAPDQSQITLQKGENILEGAYEVDRSHVNYGPTDAQSGSTGVGTSFLILTPTTGQTGKIESLIMGSYIGFNSTIFHETLHLLGISDKYEDVQTDQGPNSVPFPTWEGDIMASGHGPNGETKPIMDDRHYLGIIDTYGGLESGDYLLNFFSDKTGTMHNLGSSDPRQDPYADPRNITSTTTTNKKQIEKVE